MAETQVYPMRLLAALASEGAAVLVFVEAHLRDDSPAAAGLARGIGCHSVDSSEGSGSRCGWENGSCPDGQENGLE